MHAPQPPDCAAHEAVYRRLRASGALGWRADQEIHQLLAQVQPWLSTVPPPATLLSGRRPTRTIGRPDAIVSEITSAGFDVVSLHLEPRRDVSEHDDLFVLARKHQWLPDG